MVGVEQLELVGWQSDIALPRSYAPYAPEAFTVERIVLCKGSLDSPEREAFVRGICAVYPCVPVEERLDTPHNRVEIAEPDPLRRLERGKRTLVMGAARVENVVRVNRNPNAIFPYRQSFSVYGFCPYGCAYCYLTGSPGVWFSPTVKIYVNLPEILAEVDRRAREEGQEIVFCLGKFEDGLALDPLTEYSTVLVPFFANHPYARLLLQTKSASVERLLDLNHGGNTVLSWTLNPAPIAERYEPGAPRVDDRMAAMRRCAEHGYPVRANITPVIPDANWEELYLDFICELAKCVPLRQLTIGGIRIDPRGRSLLEQRMGKENAVLQALDPNTADENSCAFYKPGLLRRLFAGIYDTVPHIRPCSTRYDTHHSRAHLVLDFEQ